MPNRFGPLATSFLLLVGLVGLVGLPWSAADAAGATWEGHGPDGGWVTALLQPFGPGGVIYAGSYGGGVWESTDGGQSWRSAMTDRGDAIVRDLEFGPDLRNSIYAATEDQGVLRVEFGGRIWTPVNTGLNVPFLPVTPAVAVHPGLPNIVTVASELGVFTSRDRGNSYPDSLHWRAGTPMVDVKVSELAPLSIFALSPEELFFTPDRGKTVTSLAQQATGQLVDLALWPGSLDSMVVVGRKGQVLQRIEGRGFVPIGPSAIEGRAPVFHNVEVLQRGRKVIVAGGDQGLFESRDLGGSWEKRTGGTGARIPEIWAVEPASAGGGALMMGSFTRGLLVEDAPGVAWREQNQGLQATWARALDVRPGQWLCGDAHGRVHRSIDAGLNWENVTGDLNTLQITAVRALRSGPWIAGTLAGLHRSVDGGGHWSRQLLPSGHLAVHRLLHPEWMDAKEVWATTNRGVVRSLDAGATWQEVAGLGDLGAAVFAAASSPTGQLLFGPNGGPLWYGPPEGPFESFLPGPELGRFYRGFAFVGTRSVIVTSALAGQGNGGAVYRISGLGLTSIGALDLTDRIAVLDPIGGDATSVLRSTGFAAVVALPGDGLIYSEDAGLNWRRLDDGLPTRNLERVATIASTGQLVVGTLGRGVFARDLPIEVPTLVQRFEARPVDGAITLEVAFGGGEIAEIYRAADEEAFAWWRELGAGESTTLVDAAADAREIVRYELRQQGSVLARSEAVAPASARIALRLLPNVPNPFNPRTTIRFESSGGKSTVEVHDLRGRRLRTLLEAVVQAGEQQVEFDGLDDRGRALASGVYIVRILQAGHEDARRVTLVR